ncbi:unnamed protein product [Musa hybrid cultivar]
MGEGKDSSGGSGHGAMHANVPMPHSDPLIHHSSADDDYYARHSSSSATASSGYYSDHPTAASGDSSPFVMSPWHQSAPYPPCDPASADAAALPCTGLIGSLKDFAGFKSSSGLVKAIVIAADRIFTGHQDGRIRSWRVSPKDATVHKRIGTLPRLKDVLRSSLNPSNYVEIRRNRSALWIRHSDAISCLSLNEEQGLLYSGSWDKTFKAWRISDSKCLESVVAHDDAVNSVVAAFDGLVFTGSADGTVKMWRREKQGKGIKHTLVQTLLKQEFAVNSLVVMLCLSAAGSLLLSGSADKTICVWRREGAAHTCLSVLSGHSSPVKCLAMETEAGSEENGGSYAAARWIVYSGSLDKSVKVWRVSEQAPLELEQSGAYGGSNSGGSSGGTGQAYASSLRDTVTEFMVFSIIYHAIYIQKKEKEKGKRSPCVCCKEGTKIVLLQKISSGNNGLENTYAFARKPKIFLTCSLATHRSIGGEEVRFVESTKYQVADFKVGFYNGDHDDGKPFDGLLGLLDHAFSSESGSLHLDAAEAWVVDFGKEEF